MGIQLNIIDREMIDILRNVENQRIILIVMAIKYYLN